MSKMKKYLLSCILFSLLFTCLYGENYSLDGFYPFQQESVLDGMKIDGDSVYLYYKEVFLSKPSELLSYNISYIDNMPFMELSDNMPKEVAMDSEWKRNKDSIQTNNLILFLSCKTSVSNIMFAFTKGFPFDFQPLTRTRYDEWGAIFKDCSSFLTEKTKSYPVENLRKLVVDTPWVEGVKGDGIGEGFTIQGRQFTKPLGPYLLIINGYISYDKPFLYKQNNRLKKIKVTGLKSGKSKILDVLDTPHPQTVDISFITEPEDIRVEIAAVYKGTKYSDTCLHYCISFDEPVIPYENSIGE